jgi:hypothetical protein
MKYSVFAVVLLCILGTSVSQSICGKVGEPVCYDQSGGNSCGGGSIGTLPDCEYIVGSVLSIYLSGTTGTAAKPEVISFKASTINLQGVNNTYNGQWYYTEPAVYIYGTFGMKSMAIQFDSLQTLSGTLSFDSNFDSSSLSMNSLNCWHGNDNGNLDKNVIASTTWVNNTNIGDSVSGGTTIIGSFGFPVPNSYPQTLNIGRIGGTLILDTRSSYPSTSITFPKLTYLGGLSLEESATVSLSMPALKSVGNIAIEGFANLQKLDAPALELFNPGNKVINGANAFYLNNQASFSNVTLGTYTVPSSNPSCNCASPDSGFSGCKALCTSSYNAPEPTCTINSAPDLSALLKALLLAAGIIVAIVIGVCIFCCCIIGGGYWASQQRKKLADQDNQRAQNAVEVTNPVTDHVPKPEPASNQV